MRQVLKIQNPGRWLVRDPNQVLKTRVDEGWSGKIPTIKIAPLTFFVVGTHVADFWLLVV